MCGIAGMLCFDNTTPQMNILRKMGEVLEHRGPDDEGYFSEQHIGFVFKRLSIIDLQSGNQPMLRDDYVIVFNGELYNFKQLRKELESLGYNFKTNSDTEVVLYAFIQWKHKALEKFNGIWAFAVWNKREKTLFICRDRLGVKPLYYAKQKNQIIFASEIKSILLAGFHAEINKEDFTEFLHFGCITGERTMFRNIYKLLPGTWTEYGIKKCHTRRYWDINNASNDWSLSKEESEEKVVSFLEDSSKLRLVSDVPLGVLLSGGVDSSLLSYFIAESNLMNPLYTYCAVMENTEWDESRFAFKASELIGSVHNAVSISRNQYLDCFPYITWLQDEPVMFNNALFLFFICKLSKNENIKVLLSGEGADELFGGYMRFLTTLGRLKDNPRNFSKQELLILGSAIYGYDKVESLVGTVEWDNPWRRDCYEMFAHLPKADCLMRMDQRTRLVALLDRQDRMGMGAGIEIRVPFLDYRLVEFANRIPYEYRIMNSCSKILLKEIAIKNGFDKEAILRPKQGFPTPVEDWIREKKFLPYLDFVGRGDSSASELYDPDYARKLIEENYQQKGDHGNILWKLISFELWGRIFIDQTIKINQYAFL